MILLWHADDTDLADFHRCFNQCAILDNHCENSYLLNYSLADLQRNCCAKL